MHFVIRDDHHSRVGYCGAEQIIWTITLSLLEMRDTTSITTILESWNAGTLFMPDVVTINTPEYKWKLVFANGGLTVSTVEHVSWWKRFWTNLFFGPVIRWEKME